MAFSLDFVRQISVGTLRVTFTEAPNAVDASEPDDALNIDNYELNGSNENFVVEVVTVDGDPFSVDCRLAAVLSPGSNSVTVSNIVSIASHALEAPTTMSFSAQSSSETDPIGHGAQNEETQNILRRFLNPALKGRGWNSMLAALAAGDQRNWDNARFGFDQIFLSSASGAYLDRRASDDGINRPKGVNMSDELFRKLAIVQKTRKLTQLAVLEVLEVFYGRDTTRAFSDSTTGPYALQDEDDLVILLDERNTVTVTFFREHFARIGVATALEVAANITRSMKDQGSEGFAVAITDPTTNEDTVRIYSGSLGLASSVRIIGGRANTVLLFPTSLFTQIGVSPFATWDVTLSPDTQGNLRFTMTAGTEFDLFLVQEGDLAYIYGDEFEVCGTNGTFEIKAVSVTYDPGLIQWFEIENPLGNASAGIIQTGFEDLMFFRPKRKTIYDNPRHVIVCENGDHLDVVIPATTEVVDRGPGVAAYLNGQDSMAGASFSLTRRSDGRVEIDVDETHGLTVGDQVIIDGVLPTGDTPDVDAGTPSGDFSSPNDTAAGTTDASIKSVTSLAGSYEGIHQKSIRDPSGRVIIVGGATTPDSVVFTPKDNLTAFEVVSEAVSPSGGREIDYLWTQIDGDGASGLTTPNFGYRNFGISLLVDGRILCTGGAVGDDTTGTPVAGWDMLQFLPPDQVSQQSGALPAARASHAQVSLNLANGGGAVISGGWTVAGTTLATALGFSVLTQTWLSLTPMFQARMHHQLIGAAQPMAIGGATDNTETVMLNTCEIYHPGGDLWTKTGNMTYAREKFGAITLPNGRVLVVGGYGYNPTRTTSAAILASCEVYDPITELWSNIGDMPGGGRIFPIVEYIEAKNAIFVTGGGATSIDMLDLTTMKWKKSLASMGSNLIFSTGGVAADDILLICGGANGSATDTINYVVTPGADVMWLGQGLNGHFRVAEVPSATELVVYASEYDYGNVYTVAREGATVTASAAAAAPTGIPGPFSYDTKNGYAITTIAGTTDQEFNEGGNYASLLLDDTLDPEPALQFPDEEGYLVLQFGYKNVVGPIRYFGRLSDTELILDAGSVWQSSLPVGATVRLLSSRLPFSPEADALVGNFYVTGTAAGRVAAQNTINDIVAAGKQILVSVIYPGDRGLGAEGFPQLGNYKLSDKVAVWGGDDLDHEIPIAREGQ